MQYSRTLKHVQAYSSKTIDVWVVYLCEKADLGRRHRIVVWQEELELEFTTWMSLVRRFLCSIYRSRTNLHMVIDRGRR